MRKTVLAVIAAVMVGGSASAATFTTSAQFGPAPTDLDGSGAGASMLNLFDTGLGTLNSVSITATYGFSSAVTVTNSAQGKSAGTVRTESVAGFRSTSSAIDNVLRSQIDQIGAVSIGAMTIDPAAFDLLGRTQAYSLAPGASAQLTSAALTQSFSTGSLSDASTLAAFSSVGAGTFVSQLMTLTGTLLSNSGGATGATQQTTATGTLEITYDYTVPTVTAAVPEPASWAMMLVGFSLTGAAMRRRKIKVSVA